MYNEQAERNSIHQLPIPAPRGKILDRDGRVIVDNHSSYSLILTRENLKTEHLRTIADGLNLDYDDLTARVQRFTSRPKYDPIIIKEELTPAELAFVESHRDFFPEMELIPSQRRLYPQNGFAAHVIGYTGEISEQELDSPDFAKYNQGDVIGKFGIERQYNDTLMGVDGERQVVVDNRGKTRKVLANKEAIPGKDLQLTLDLDLQAVAELAMEGKNGAVVAMDPRTGEVLAMVSRPTFDPNKFAVRIKSSDWREIADNPDHPLLNRAIQAQDAPGSTFKPFVAIAGLESGAIDDQFTVHCPGGAIVLRPLLQVLVEAAVTAPSRCTGAFSSRATFISITWATARGSTRSRSTPTRPDWDKRPASTCRTKRRAWCPPRHGRSAISARSGTPVKPSRWPSAKVR